MDKKREEELIGIAKPIMLNGRNGDWEHVTRAVGHGKYLLVHEDGDEDIVIPTLYLHDIGWTRVDYSDFTNASPAQKKDAQSVLLHMKYGAEMAAELLSEMRYPADAIQAISDIIAIHDDPEKVFAKDDPSATLVVEADRMDRYGPEGVERYKTLFGEAYLKGERWEAAKKIRREGITTWFKTKTARMRARELGEQMGLFE